jgi:hypothetical protein
MFVSDEEEALPGWKLYDAVQEYARLGIYPSSEWRLTVLNKVLKIALA